jgi:hypothetical protein
VQIFKALGDSVSSVMDHGLVKALVPILAVVLGWYAKRLIDWFRWSRKQFLHRMIVSLNTLDGDKLLIRTIFEKSVEEVFLNSVATNIVLSAAANTTNKDPLLQLPKEDAWHILNSVLNAVAEEFSEGVVRRDMGLPTKTERYCLCLTHEVADDVKQDKIRVMMIRSELLANLPAKAPHFELAHHQLRFQTLQAMAAARKSKPELVMEVEICLPA